LIYIFINNRFLQLNFIIKVDKTKHDMKEFIIIPRIMLKKNIFIISDTGCCLSKIINSLEDLRIIIMEGDLTCQD
jgi:hypothetical protein